MASPVLFESKNDCLDVILNRPDEGNLITNEMGLEIRADAARDRSHGQADPPARQRREFLPGPAGAEDRPRHHDGARHAPSDRRGAARALRRGQRGARADARDRAGRGARRRPCARGGVRHHACGRQRHLPGAGAQPQHRADAGDVGPAQPRPLQDHRLSRLFARAHHCAACARARPRHQGGAARAAR